MATNGTVFQPGVHTAEEWLASVAREFATDDQRFAYRAVRAWLHGLLDELPVEVCAHFAAQLPEVLRGVYCEGWDPSQVPVEHDLDAYVRRFAREAHVRPAEVRHVAATVRVALRRHLSGAQLATALERLPQRPRELLWVAPRTEDQPSTNQVPGELEDRLARLENQVRTVTGAVTELVHGHEHTPLEEPTNTHAAQAAHRAHPIPLAGQP